MNEIERLKTAMGLLNQGPTKGPKGHHRKNGKGRRYKTISWSTGPARDANQKTTFTQIIEVKHNQIF